jgi:hypothetical protein
VIPIAAIALWPARRDDSISVSDLMLVRREYTDRPNKTEELHGANRRIEAQDSIEVLLELEWGLSD